MNAIFTLLNLNNTVTINRPLAHAIGLNEAIVFAAVVAKQSYYARREMLDDEGWFYSTVDDLYESTALTKYQQSTAVKKLVDLGLIEVCRKGLPARRYFRLNEDTALLENLLQEGEAVIRRLSPLSNSSRKTEQQEDEKLYDKIEEDQAAVGEESGQHTINLNNKSKVMNPDQSIPQSANEQNEKIDGETEGQTISTTDAIDYHAVIRANIDYDWFYENRNVKGLGIDMPKVDEIFSIMCDVVCSTKPTIRVNGEEMPTERVKQRFLQLRGEHIEYVIDAMKDNPNEIRNIRAYWITALYNATSTMDSYYGEMLKKGEGGIT